MRSIKDHTRLMLVVLGVSGCAKAHDFDSGGCVSGPEPDTIRSAATVALDLHLSRSSYPLAITAANSDSLPGPTGAEYRTTPSVGGDQLSIVRRASRDSATNRIDRDEGEIARVFLDRSVAGTDPTPAAAGDIGVTIRSCALGATLFEPTDATPEWQCIGQGVRTPPHEQLGQGTLTQTGETTLLLSAHGDEFTLSATIALGEEEPNPSAGSCAGVF